MKIVSFFVVVVKNFIILLNKIKQLLQKLYNNSFNENNKVCALVTFGLIQIKAFQLRIYS